jgi:hypothetical protein
MIQLKTIQTNPQRFAALVDPDVPVKSNDQLYAVIKAVGSAQVAIYKPGSYEVEKIETITPDEFERTWQGD